MSAEVRRTAALAMVLLDSCSARAQVVFVACAVAIIINRLVETPTQSFVGLGLILRGAPDYLLACCRTR